MKKTAIFLALIFVACSRSVVPVADSDKTSDIEDDIVLQVNLPERSRTYFEPQDPSGYKMLWSRGDEIGIFSYDLKETGNINVRATLVDSYAGSTQGVFIPETIIIPSWEGDRVGSIAMPTSEEETFFVYYPYNEKTDIDIDDHCVHSTLESEQNHDLGSEGSSGFSYAYANVSPGEKKINFTLKSAMAYLRIVVKSTEYEGYRLQSVQFLDACESVPISGDFAFDMTRRVILPIESRTFFYAKVNVTPDFQKTEKAMEQYITVFPGDYSSAEPYMIFSLVNSEKNVVTIPVKLNKIGTLTPGAIKMIELENIGRSTCPAWYEPADNRDFLDACAYGAQNTWCVQAGGSVTFDVKARGNILKADVPKYYGIMLASNVKNQNLLSLGGEKTYEPSPTRLIPDDYRITVDCIEGSSASFGVIAIYNEAHNLLWSFMIWKYEQGDPIGDVRYSGITEYSFMDRALGARKSIAAALKEGKADEGAAYFNWGRKDPFPWKQQCPAHYRMESGDGKSLQYAIANPNVRLSMTSKGTDNHDNYWYDDNPRRDLWGATNPKTTENPEIKGHKTIYDPCPEGYQVPDYKALSLVDENKKLAEKEFATSDLRYFIQHNGTTHLELPCPFSDMSALAIMKEDGKTYDYWLYHGLLWGNTVNMGNGSTDALVTSYSYWSNQCTSSYSGVMLQGWYNGAGTSWFFDTTGRMADAYSVRCQVIEK